jgi:hypothetical protein
MDIQRYMLLGIIMKPKNDLLKYIKKHKRAKVSKSISDFYTEYKPSKIKPIKVTKFQEGAKQYVVKLQEGKYERYVHADDLQSAIKIFEDEPTAVKVYTHEIICTKRVYAEREV